MTSSMGIFPDSRCGDFPSTYFPGGWGSFQKSLTGIGNPYPLPGAPKRFERRINNIHKRHHNEIHYKTYNNGILNIIKHQIYFLPIIYFKIGIYIWIGYFKYEFIHMCLHIYPQLLPSKLIKHHTVHHINPNVNFSFTCIWPDKLFKTYYTI